MKILKIEGNKGEVYINTLRGYKSVLDIEPKDIKELLYYLYEHDDIENIEKDNNFDDLKNEAQKIVYKNLYDKIVSFLQELESTKNHINGVISKLREKYLVNGK